MQNKHIIALKLRSGESILAEFIDQSNGDYTVLDPIQMHLRFRDSDAGEYSYNYPTLYFPYGVDNKITFIAEDLVTVDMASDYYTHIYLESLRMCIESEEKKKELLQKVLEKQQKESEIDAEKSLDNETEPEYNESTLEENNEQEEDGFYGYLKTETGDIKSFIIPNTKTKH